MIDFTDTTNWSQTVLSAIFFLYNFLKNTPTRRYSTHLVSISRGVEEHTCPWRSVFSSIKAHVRQCTPSAREKKDLFIYIYIYFIHSATALSSFRRRVWIISAHTQLRAGTLQNVISFMLFWGKFWRICQMLHFKLQHKEPLNTQISSVSPPGQSVTPVPWQQS